MKKLKFKNFLKKKTVDIEEVKVQEFLDTISPSIIKFYSDYFICGNTYRSVWAIRQYPTSTEEQALLRYLGEKENITLKIYSRLVTPIEEKRIIANASNKNKMRTTSSTQVQDIVEAQSDATDLTIMIANMHRSREPLVHCAVFIEMIASDVEALTILQSDVSAELIRSKINVDKLLLRQKEGFLSVSPSGYNPFKEEFLDLLIEIASIIEANHNYDGDTIKNRIDYFIQSQTHYYYGRYIIDGIKFTFDNFPVT